MELRAAVPTDAEEGYTTTHVSTDGLWKIGLMPVLFGVRVVAWRRDSFCRTVDYCAGSNTPFLLELLETIVKIFETQIKEGATEKEVMAMMPMWERRPIDQDSCWPKLQAMAGLQKETI